MNPIAFTVGTLEVRWYGIMVALAVAAVILWTMRQAESEKRKGTLPAKPDIAVAPAGIAGGAIGAKLVHVLERLDYYVQHPVEIFSGGGLAIFGGVLGCTLGIWLYLRFFSRDKEGIRAFGFYGDLAAPGILLAQAIGRVGCLINGCCYGTPAPSWLPWSVVYTNPNSFAPLNTPLHPNQAYEIIFCLVAFGILLRMRNRYKGMEGALLLFYLALYSAWRLGDGFLRIDNMFSGLSQAQIISIVVLIVSIILIVRLQRRHRQAMLTAGLEKPSPPEPSSVG